jgi:N-acyl-D-amino-acid deacylase
VTIFDYEKMTDRATFAEPALPPAGIEYVLIGGETVLKEGHILKDNCGRSVRT